MKNTKRYVSTFYFLVLAFALGACSEANKANIQIKIVPGLDTSFQLQGVNANHTAGAHPKSGTQQTPFGASEMSSTGLYKKYTCYAAHVIAPDLVDARTIDSKSKAESCAFPELFVHGLGRISPRAYKYGDSVNMVIPAGTNRRIDLVGFFSPYGAADPNCEKPLKVEVVMVKNNDGIFEGRPRFIYGEYVIDRKQDSSDELPVPAGLKLPPNDTGVLAHFAASARQNIAAGNQTIELRSLAWETVDGEFKPYKYADCDNGSSGTPGNSYNSSVTFPPLNPGSGTQKAFIFTGMDSKGFLEIQCPSGVNHIQLLLHGTATFNSGDNPKTCSGGKVVYEGLDFSAAGWVSGNSECSGFDCIDFTINNPDNGNILLYEGHLYRASRYAPVANQSYSASPTEVNLGPLSLPKFVGYKRSGSNRYLFVKEDSSYIDSIYSVAFQPQTSGSERGALDWDGSATTNFLTGSVPAFKQVIFGLVDALGSPSFNFFGIESPGVTNIVGIDWSATTNYYNHPLTIDNWSGSPILGASDNGTFVTSNNYPGGKMFNGSIPTNGSGYINSPNHGLLEGDPVFLTYVGTAPETTYCVNYSGQSSGIIHVISQEEFVVEVSGSIVSDVGSAGCILDISTTNALYLKAFRSDNISNTPQVFDIPVDLSASSGINGILVDMPASGGHIVSYGNSNIQYTYCGGSNNDCLNPFKSTLSVSNVDSADLIVGTGNPILITAGGASSIQLNRIQLNNGTLSAATTPTLYPASPTGTISNVIVKSLTKPDNNINKPDVMLGFNDGTNSYLYRSRDFGQTWYLVYTAPMGQFAFRDIAAVENSYADGNFGPAFAILGLNGTGDSIMLGEDGQHGF